MDLPASSELERWLDGARAEVEKARLPVVDGRGHSGGYIDGNRRSRAGDKLEWAEKQWARGQQRDAIQATRPENCFCLGTGEAKRNERSSYDRKVWCPCPEGQAAHAAEVERERIASEKAHEKKMLNFWDAARIPNRFMGCTMETHPGKDLPAYKAMKAALKDFNAEGWAPWSESWYLWGPVGTGKTGLAIGYAHLFLDELDDSGSDVVLFRRVPDLLTELRATYNHSRKRDEDDEEPTESDLLERYQNADLLVLDDLGAEQLTGSGWVEDKLYQIIGGRHDEERATVFTSNLDLDAMKKRIGERITWRIAEACGPGHILEVKGRNLRDWRNA